jgi:alkylation response protein AidB-like acyl-CoA dehydrogenase
MAAEMEQLAEACPDGGSRYVGLAARALNHMIAFADTHRLTRQQIIMFDLADMMIHVEIGAAAARRAVALAPAGGLPAERAALVSRLFADELCQVFTRNIPRILTGTGEIEPATVATSMAETKHGEFGGGCRNGVKDMDRLADMVFGR